MMNETLRVAYQSPDLEFDILVRPLRAWHEFLATKIGESPDAVIATAWKVGYLLDILLGPFALLGVFFKSFQVSSLKKHNRALINELRQELSNVLGILQNPEAGLTVGAAGQIGTSSSYQPKVQHEFAVKEERLDAICGEIKAYVEQSVRYLTKETRDGAITTAEGNHISELVVSFTALDPKL